MIVALESASPDQSVALVDPSGAPLTSSAWTANRGQGGELLPRLGALLRDRGVGWSDVSAVAVGIGPGSFTGLRVGLALAKGLAVGAGCPIVGVPSLVAWLRTVPEADGALVRAGAAEAYALAREGDAPQVIPFAAIDDAARARSLVAPRELTAALHLAHARAPDAAAEMIGLIAAERLVSGDGDDLSRLEPIYVRPPRGLAELDTEVVQWL